MLQRLRVTRLNDVPAGYNLIMALQEAIFQQRKLNKIPDTMLLLQVCRCGFSTRNRPWRKLKLHPSASPIHPQYKNVFAI